MSGPPAQPTSATTPTWSTARVLTLIGLALTVLAILAMYTLTLPLKAIGIPAAIAALVLLIIALANARRAKLTGLLITGVVLCMICNVLLALTLSAWTILANYTAPYEQCMKGALTSSAQQECQTTLLTSLEKLQKR